MGGAVRPGARVSKERFKERVPELRELLLEAQFDLRERADGALLLLLAGPDGASKAALGHRLCEWLDMRFIETRAFEAPSKLERAMPWLWRYWRALPAKGGTGLFYGSWYNDALLAAIDDGHDRVQLENSLRRINVFERMLALEGVRILKVWLASEHDGDEPAAKAGREERWRHLGSDPAAWAPAAEQMLQITSTGHAPWVVVDGDDARTRDLSVGEMVLEVMAQRVNGAADEPAVASPAFDRPASAAATFLEPASAEPMDSDKYASSLAKQQKKFARLVESEAFEKRSLLLVFEGVDAAGKGGAIRRITEALDPRRFQVHPYSAPSVDERLYPYLWRFWAALPMPGKVAIFDRSYYGRVLVERVEGLCTPAEWSRAYGEIATFELQLLGAGVIVQKFWLSISKEEQLRRFEDRRTTAWKRHKITEEDWRNRERWDDYERAAVEMIDRTSVSDAPWHVVNSEDKQRARIEVLKTINRELGRILDAED